MRTLILLIVMMIALASCKAEHPLTVQAVNLEEAIICETDDRPDFSSKNCSLKKRHQIDPQGKQIWGKAVLTIEHLSGSLGEPLALMVSGKFSGAYYINGQFIGRSGQPAGNKQDEIIGAMDNVIPIAPDVLRLGENEIIFQLSSHHGLITLNYPLHRFAIAQYEDPTNRVLAYYWPALLTLGIFLSGMVYFGVLNLLKQEKINSLLLSGIFAFAALQLMSEVSRGLFAYAYSLHDLRLLIITISAFGFGHLTLAYVLTNISIRKVWQIVFVSFLASVIAVVFSPSFDFKTILAMSIPMGIAFGMAAYRSLSGGEIAKLYAIGLAGFLIFQFLFLFLFLDIVFYYLVAAFLIFLFVQQSMAFTQEQERRLLVEAEAEKLSLALEESQKDKRASCLEVRSIGKLEKIPLKEIAYCKASDGCTELYLVDGRMITNSATLSEVEPKLAGLFLKVHRSYIVNKDLVMSLKRAASGTGELTLQNEATVPVSRRIMPKVREALLD